MSAIFGLAIIWWGLIGLAGFLLGVYAIGAKMNEFGGQNGDHLGGRKAWLIKHFGAEGCRKWLENEKADKAGLPCVKGYSRPTMAEWNVKAKWYGAATMQAPWGTYYWPDRFSGPNVNDVHAAGMVVEQEEPGYWTSARLHERAEKYRSQFTFACMGYGTSCDRNQCLELVNADERLIDQPFKGAGRIRVEVARSLRAFEQDEIRNRITGRNDKTTGLPQGWVQVHGRKYLGGNRYAFGWYQDVRFKEYLRRYDRNEFGYYDRFPYGIPDVHGLIDGVGSWVEVPLNDFEKEWKSSTYFSSEDYMQKQQRAIEECRWVKVEDFERVVRERAEEFNQFCPFDTGGTGDDNEWAHECRIILGKIKVGAK